MTVLSSKGSASTIGEPIVGEVDTKLNQTVKLEFTVKSESRKLPLHNQKLRLNRLIDGVLWRVCIISSLGSVTGVAGAVQ